MTREEAIAYGESKKARIKEKLIRVGSSYGDYAIYYSEMAFTSAALAALREQEERDNRLESDAVKNEPLTLDELRQMDWEPVWCLCKPIDGGNGFWCICKKGTIIPPSGVRFDVKEIPHWVFLRNKPKEE